MTFCKNIRTEYGIRKCTSSQTDRNPRIITGPDKVLLNMYWISPAIESLHLFGEYNICNTSYTSRGEGQCDLKAVSGYIIKVWKAL